MMVTLKLIMTFCMVIGALVLVNLIYSFFLWITNYTERRNKK
jgi:hypothetical protein